MDMIGAGEVHSHGNAQGGDRDAQFVSKRKQTATVR
jgi:hypothetical protein